MNQILQPGGENEDKAWVTVQTPLPIAELRSFCAQIEHLYRINPYLDFEHWQATGPDSFRTAFHNHSNNRDVVLDISLKRESEDVFSVHYAQGIKQFTRFQLEPTADGSRLTITDDYSKLGTAERQTHQADVDRSLPGWGHALYEFFRRWKRWSRFGPWRWYMYRVWMPMKPSSRRVTWMLVLITAVEFLFFLFVLLIYLVEQNR